MAAPGVCHEPEDKRKCTQPEMERMSGDVMELIDTELDNIGFSDETESDDSSNDSHENFVL